MNRPTLYIFSGLPAAGKTTLARLLSQRLGAAHIRIDTIEQALGDLCDIQVHAQGYELAYRICADILNAGNSAVADSCNALQLTRRQWEQVAEAAHVPYVVLPEKHLICDI